MLPFFKSCREFDRKLGQEHPEFLEEADKIVAKDAQDIADRLAKIEAEKAEKKASYLAPQFAAIDQAGNFCLQGKDYTARQKTMLLGALLRRSAVPGAIKNIAEATDAELEIMVSQFGSIENSKAIVAYNINTHESEPEIMGPTHPTTQCHLEFLYPEYHQFLSSEHIQPGFMPTDVANSRHYLVVGGGPVGLVMAIEALLRGHRVTVVDSRTADKRDRYVGVWPKDITRLTQFGVAESAWVVWTVLNATNDRAPKMRRNTSRLFLNISVVVRILTWTAVKLGATVLRGVYFNVDDATLCKCDAAHTPLSHISYDEVVFATGAVGMIPQSVLTSTLNATRSRPFAIAQALLRQTPPSEWASLFQGEPIHCTRYLLNEAQAKTSLSAIRDIDDAQAELLSNVPSLFIQLPAECVYGNIPTEEQDLTESVFLPPGWHITGLTRVTDRKMFKIIIFGPLPGRLGASLATATDPVAIGQSLLASTQTTGSSDREYCLEQLLRAQQKGLVYVINSDFQHILRPENIYSLGRDCFDKPNVDLSKWDNASLHTAEDGRRYFVIGDCLSTPWYKLALGLFDGITHVNTYWQAIDRGENLQQAIAASEYQLCRRQIHICTSLVTINSELAAQGVLQRLINDSRRDSRTVRGWSDSDSSDTGLTRARSSGVSDNEAP